MPAHGSSTTTPTTTWKITGERGAPALLDLRGYWGVQPPLPCGRNVLCQPLGTTVQAGDQADAPGQACQGGQAAQREVLSTGGAY